MSEDPGAERAQRIVIDGQEYTADDLTFREQRELRDLVQQLAGRDYTERVAADGSVVREPLQAADASLMDFLPALVTVLKRRQDPAYSVENALNLRLDEVLQDRPTGAAESEETGSTLVGSGTPQT